MTNTPTATHAHNGGRRRTIALVMLVVVALVAASLVITHYLRGKAIEQSGETVTSANGSVSVTFGPGEVDRRTRVDIEVGLGGPAPPDMVAPLGRPFDITAVSGEARTGWVSVRVGPLPAGVAPDLVVMLVEEGSGWRALDTTFDPATGTASARWPHFSQGVVGWFDPLFDARDAAVDIGAEEAKRAVGAGATAVEWTGEQYDRAGDWVAKRTADVAAKITEGLVAAGGGTVHEVTCDPASEDWTFTGSASGGGDTDLALLTGCGYPFDKPNASSPVRVGNRAPHPFLLTLPRGVSGPGWAELFSTMDLEDAAASLMWSLADRAVLPAGKSIALTVGEDAGRTVQVDGVIDISTLAVRAVALAAVYFSRGESAIVRRQLQQVIERLAEKLAAERRAGLTSYTLADLARDTGYDSALSREIRSADAALGAHIVDQGLAFVSLMSCAVSLSRNGLGPLSLSGALDQLMDSCFQPFVVRTVRNTAGEITGYLDPHKQAKTTANLVKGFVAESLNIRKLVSAAVSGPIGTLARGEVDLQRAGLTMRCVADPCTTSHGKWDIPLGELVYDRVRDGSMSSQLFRLLSIPACEPEAHGLDGGTIPTIINWFVAHDVDGDGMDEAIVSAECDGSTSSWPETVMVLDGAAGPDTPALLGGVLLTNGFLTGPSVELRALEAVTNGATITLSGTACCGPNGSHAEPDLRYQQDFSWTGERWKVGAYALTPVN